MPFSTATFRAVAAGCLLGPLILSLLVVLYRALFAPDAFRDGQYAIVFFFVVPMGALVGGLAGAVAERVGAGYPVTAGRVSLAGGTLLLGIALACAANVGDGSRRDALIAFFYPWFGWPGFWGLLFAVLGLWLAGGGRAPGEIDG